MKNTIPNKPNDKLRHQRELRGWTQKKVGMEVDTSKETVSRWETGERVPSKYFQERLCKLYNLSATDLGFMEETPLNVLPPLPFSDTLDKRDMDIKRRTITKGALSILGLSAVYPLFTPEIGNAIQLYQSNTQALEDFLSQCRDNLKTCWNLFYSGSGTMVEPYLQACLPQLIHATQTTLHQKNAATITSQAYQLAWLLALQKQNFGQALSAIKQSFSYGELTKDPNILLSSIVREAHVYFHLNNPVKQAILHEQALQYVKGSSPLLQSWLYLVMAECYAHLQQEKEAKHYLELAYNTFPNNPEQDINFEYVPINTFWFANYTVLSYLHLQQPKKALDTLNQYGHPSAISPLQAELANRQLSTFLIFNDLDQTCHQFEIAEKTAKQSGSNLRYTEVCNVYAAMRTKWAQEPKVKALEELFR